MTKRVTLLRKWSTLIFVGTLVFALKTNLFAFNTAEVTTLFATSYIWGHECSEPDDNTQFLPCGEDWCQTLLSVDTSGCHADDTEACMEDEWLSFDLASGCNQDCAANYMSEYQYPYLGPTGACSFSCVCGNGS
jgi:hypothetical protein